MDTLLPALGQSPSLAHTQHAVLEPEGARLLHRSYPTPAGVPSHMQTRNLGHPKCESYLCHGVTGPAGRLLEGHLEPSAGGAPGACSQGMGPSRGPAGEGKKKVGSGREQAPDACGWMPVAVLAPLAQRLLYRLPKPTHWALASLLLRPALTIFLLAVFSFHM